MVFYFNPVYEGFGVSAMWAVLTVVVVFEFSVGATIGKGLNRMLATLLGGSLGYGAHRIARSTGEIGEPILLSIFVFIFAGVVTYARFAPKLKARYDYGMMVFILTFCLVSVSGYRDDEVLKMAVRRVLTIVMGSCVCLLISLFVFPVWIGQDLHNHIASNLEHLASFLQGFENEYFLDETEQDSSDKSGLQGYKKVLTSKSNEENMANLARWEPGHGKFRFGHPWEQYLKVGNLARKCAYKIEALSCYVDNPTSQKPEMKTKMEDPCKRICRETGKALTELATSIRTMTKLSSLSSSNSHIANSKEAAEALRNCLHLITTPANNNLNLLEIIPVATVASLLLEVVVCTENIAQAVSQLSDLAKFKSSTAPPPSTLLASFSASRRTAPEPMGTGEQGQQHVITVGE
ncbi:Aluminum-activated malate transporter 2 [Linum grandiflorum]